MQRVSARSPVLAEFETGHEMRHRFAWRLPWLLSRRRRSLSATCRGRSCHARSRLCARRMQFLNPLHHDLHITQVAQALEECFSGLLHRLPFAIRIHGDHSVGHGSAPPQRNPQIVYRIGAEVCAHVLALLQYPLHPVPQSRDFAGRLHVSIQTRKLTPRVFY